jgi:hypothetical protein
MAGYHDVISESVPEREKKNYEELAHTTMEVLKFHDVLSAH